MNNDILKSRFIAIDGDDVGPTLRSFIISNDVEGATAYSNGLKSYFQELKVWLVSRDAVIVFCGGDSILAFSNPRTLPTIIEQIPLGLCPISVGIGDTAEVAYLALQLAKARGKSQIVDIADIHANTVRVLKDDVPQMIMNQIRELSIS